MALPGNIDARLWFTTKDGGSNHKFYFYTHNPQTFYGRMYAYDPDRDQSFCVSKYEIAIMSAESEYFVKGFLAGNEPSPPEGQSGPLSDDDPRFQRWKRAVDLWYLTGTWVDGRICEKCSRRMLPSNSPGLICEDCLGLPDI